MTTYREASNNAKAARQGIKDQRPVGRLSRRERPFIVEYRLKPRDKMAKAFKSMTAWSKYGAYRTKEEADQVIATQGRKCPYYDLRHKTEESTTQ